MVNNMMNGTGNKVVVATRTGHMTSPDSSNNSNNSSSNTTNNRDQYHHLLCTSSTNSTLHRLLYIASRCTTQYPYQQQDLRYITNTITHHQ